MDIFKDITEFHEKFGLTSETKGLLSDEMFAFRARFLNEEMSELEGAHDEGDFVRFLDGCIDIIYVAAGTMVLAGFSPEEMREAWRRVHEANMKKIRARYADESTRGSAFDVVKPKGWEPPDLEDLCR